MSAWARDSLRLRLLAGTLAWVLLSVLLAGWGLRALLREHITQQLQQQLVVQLDALSGSIDSLPGGRVRVEHQPDARLQQPLSGLYWQIDRLGANPQPGLARSRSLWDQVLSLSGAEGHTLLAVVRTLQLPEDDAPPLRLVVAGDEALIAEPLQRFTRLLGMALAILALGLALAVVLQLHLALRPLHLLRTRLAAVRAGQAAQLAGQFPQELQPLVAEFNHVLRENADMVQRARTQAGNLAHAVNTPLTILANAAAQDPGPLAQLVSEQVASARRQVDAHLARARAAAAVRATGLATPALPIVQALVRTMARLHAGRQVQFSVAEGAQAGLFRGEEPDLYEMLGNLLDNAGKSARQQVQVDVQCADGQLCFTIDDDGPGIAPELRQRMFARGVQLDEQRPGSGLGLDIVRTLAHTYGGRIEVLDAPLGGARLRLWLPQALAE